MICNDTGPRHLAIAYNIPVVVLMGPTSPIVTHSDYPRTVILRQDVPCAPVLPSALPDRPPLHDAHHAGDGRSPRRSRC